MKFNPIYLIVLLLAFGGCSEAPEDYNAGRAEDPAINPDQVVPDVKDVELLSIDGVQKPAWDVLEDPLVGGEGEGSIKADAKATAISLQPMIYEVGAAGITFKTTLEVARPLLSKPRIGPDASGMAYYEGEDMQIYWRTDEPRVPDAFLLRSRYQGAMKMANGAKPIRMKHSFVLDGYTPNEEGAQQLARDYYRNITGDVAEQDCLATQKCLIDWGTKERKEFVFMIPGRLQWLLGKDRFELFLVLLLKNVEQGILASDFDILSGQFLVPGPDATEENPTFLPLGFGQTFQEIEERLQIEALTGVGSSTFSRQYDGIYLVYKRTKFDRVDTQPLPTDIMTGVQVSANYRNLLTLAGEPIVVVETPQSVDVMTLSDFQANPAPAGAKVLGLQTNLAIQSKNVRSFAEKLTKFLEVQMQKQYPDALVMARFSGAHQVIQIKNYSSYVVAYDAKKDDGAFISFDIGEEQGNLDTVFMTKVGSQYNEFDPLLLTKTKTAIEKRPGSPFFDTLSGVKIGEVVTVQDWDLGRGEATVSLYQYSRVKAEAEATDFVRYTARAAYTDISAMFIAIPVEENIFKAVPQDQAYVRVGSLSVSLGLKLIKEIPETLTSKASREYRVVSIDSTLHNSEIRGLCGGKFTPVIGMSDTEFMKQLSAVPECQTFIENDTTGAGRIANVYFPNDRLQLSFGDAELIVATVYAPINEVK